MGTIRGRTWRTLSAVLLLLAVSVSVAYAASLSDLSLTLSTSEPDATGVKHTFVFAAGTTGNVKGVRFQYCTSGSGTCTLPTGASTTASTIHADTDDQWESSQRTPQPTVLWT